MKTAILLLALCAYTVYGRYLDSHIGFPFESRVVGGEDAKPHSAPYIVSLQNYQGHFCGGSLIDNHTVVTAAHCIRDIPCSMIKVVAGLHDLKKPSGSQERSINGCVKHKKYPGRLGPYDIGLIFLSEPVEFNDKIKPIALPANEKIHSGDVVLFGWGSTSTALFPNILQTVTKPIIEYSLCQQLVNRDSPLHPTNVCAGRLEGGLSACNGDSGGPLTQTNENGVVELVGIVSWVYLPCGQPRRPSVYVRVSAFIDWINENRRF